MTTDVTRLPTAPRVGIIGGGFMSVVHARAARSAGAHLVAVSSRTIAGARAARAALGAERASASVEELLRDDSIDVVHVCTPNETHAGIASAVLRAGKHVVCEKPLATSADEAERLADLAADSGLVASVPFVYRFHPMVREARARVRSGRTGRIFSISGSYLQDWLAAATDDDWRVDPRHGGPSRAFADIGSHLCDILEFVTGDRISRLCSQLRTVHADRSVNKGVTTEDLAAVLVEFESGAIGTLQVSQVALGHKNGLTFHIAGENETLAFDQETPDRLHIGSRDGFLVAPRSDTLAPEAARYSVVPAGHPQGYQDAFNAFVADTYRAIADFGAALPDGLPTFEDGVRAAVLTDAVLRSASVGGWVDARALSPIGRPAA
jgi:predicted dehydrogenase